MKLFGHPESGHAYKVRLYLSLFDIAHEYDEIDIMQPLAGRPGQFRQASRFGEVPCLIDGDRTLVQSNAILLYLQENYGPSVTVHQRARNSEWLFWEANKIGLCLPQLRSARYLNDTSYNTGALDWLQSRYDSDVARIAKELADDRSFILGDKVSAADCSLCGYLYFAEQAQVVVPESVQAWLERIAALPGWKAPYDLMQA